MKLTMSSSIKHSVKLLTWFLLFAVPSTALAADEREAKLKAAFILNFAKFVDWPPDHFSPIDKNILFCFVGVDRNRKHYIDTFEQKQVKGKQALVRITGYDAPLNDCSVLFVRGLNQGQLAHLQSVLTGRPILTIGETDLFMEAGGMIRFYAHQGKIRFEINPAAAKRSGLAISSKLLNLARIRGDDGGAEP